MQQASYLSKFQLESSSFQKEQQVIKANESVSVIEKIFQQLISQQIYPGFRYTCPYCETMGLLIRVDKSIPTTRISCLQCKKTWINNIEVRACLC